MVRLLSGINVILEIDHNEPSWISQWQNVDLDLSKSTKLVNVIKILYRWYKCNAMMNFGVGFKVPISQFETKENDKDKNKNKNKNKNKSKNKNKNDEYKILRKKKKKAIKESKWVELVIKAIIHVFQFQVETKDVIRCLRKKESGMACFLNQTICISLKLDENNASMLLLVKINPSARTTVLG